MESKTWKIIVLCSSRGYSGGGSNSTLQFADEAAAREAFAMLIAARDTSRDHENGTPRSIAIKHDVGECSFICSTLTVIHLVELGTETKRRMEQTARELVEAAHAGINLNDRGIPALVAPPAG